MAERFGTFKQEPFECEAYICRNRKGEYYWLIKVKEEGSAQVREYEEPMISSYEDKDEEGNTTAMNVDPKDLANVQILQDKTEKILGELMAESGREMVSPSAGTDGRPSGGGASGDADGAGGSA